jgi:outer membrane receptor protein involved in Fe transport
MSLSLLKKLIFLFTVSFCIVAAAAGQEIRLKGRVTDRETRLPVAGVSVTIKGTTVAEKTDPQGRFQISSGRKSPLTIVFSSVGYAPAERVISGSTDDLGIELTAITILGQEVVISATRTPERILESPVSIERVSGASLSEAPALSFYDALNNLKGVDMTTQSLTYRTINTRGFGSHAGFRLNQFVDGMDNLAPGLNFPVGNIIGVGDLDLDNVELLPGASSALYGAGGISGTLLMTSKDPFKHPGISFQFKSGINHVNDDQSSVQPFNQLDVRVAKAWNNKFGFKSSFSFLQANEWIANNNSNYDRVARRIIPGNRETDPNYDGVHVYGDEVSQNMRNVAQSVLSAGESAFVKQYGEATGGMIPSKEQINGFLQSNAQTAPFFAGINTPGLLPNENISRTGYKESDLANQKAESLKTSTAVYYKFNSTIQAIAQANWGKGSTMYTGSDRYVFRNFTIGQYKLELKGDDFFVRGYTTQERSGDSYITSILGSYINEQSKVSQQWFPEYIGNYIGARLNPGVTSAQAHSLARAAADQGRFIPGTPAFETAKNEIMGKTISSGNGARFDDKTNLYHYEGMYNLTSILKNVLELQVGSSYRIYQLRSGGTIFDDLNRKLNINEYGAYAVAGKKFLNNKLKLTVAGRYDKSENFEAHFTPRATGVYTLSENHHIRASYQTGYRNPTTQNQYLDLSAGGGSLRLIGGLPEMLNKYRLFDNKPFTANSYHAFLTSAALGVADPSLLKTYNFDPEGVQPETVHAFELGDKMLIAPNLLLDGYVYYNRYKNFISEIEVYQNNEGSFTGVNVPVNVKGDIKAYGAAVGLDYLYKTFNISGNVSYNELGDLPADYTNDYGFNTPKFRFNLGLGNKNIIRNLGFNLNYHWQQAFYWSTPFVAGQVPAYGTLDGQLNYKIPSVNSIIKLGGTNLLNKYYISSFGDPALGALYYISYGFNL